MSTTNRYQLTWDLDSLFPHPESAEFARLLSAYESDLKQLAEDSERLPAVETSRDGVAAWVTFVDRYGDLSARNDDLHSFVGCHAAAEAANKEFQRLEGVLAAMGPLREQVLTNLQLAFRDVSESQLEAFLAADARLADVAFFFWECRRNAAFRLPKSEELLAAQLDVDGLHAWSRLYDRLSGDLRVTVMEKGELVRKSPGQVTLDSPERSVRENNFYAAGRAWATIADSCAAALNHLSGSRLTKSARLGVRDHLDWPLRLNRMRRETLETMWSTIADRKSVLLNYLDAKAQLFGLERLCWYDVTAPLPTRRPAPPLEYDDACEIVIRTFTAFSPEWGEFAEKAMAERWIEAENRDGKRQGGFCTELATRQQSRIFMTFTGSDDSMSTLAHELGHAYHSYVLRDRPILLREYPMNLAETASTLAEAILNERRLADADDEHRRALLDRMLSDAVTFLMNIHARFLFEDRFHRERVRGELSAAQFSELMREAQREAYLDALDENGWYPEFWISKLHFYGSDWPFYNFPYTFGYLLSLGIYGLRDEQDSFPEQIRPFLIATGAQQAEEAVADAFGADLSQPAFWQRSLDVVEQQVRQFVALAE